AAAPVRRGAATDRPPTAAGAYRAEASLVLVFAVEHLFDLILEHRVEIVRHADPRHKAQPFDLSGGRSIERDDFHERLAGLGNDERLALRGAIDEARQMRLRLMHVDRAHSSIPRLD